MIDAPVAVEDEDAMLLRRDTVASVNAVVWPVVPLAGDEEEALCKGKVCGQSGRGKLPSPWALSHTRIMTDREGGAKCGSPGLW